MEVAELVLSEDEPSLDLAPEERWAASIRGKNREISGILRHSIGELLVLLAVHGDEHRIGSSSESVTARIDRLVSTLLKGKEARGWLAKRGDLRLLAEASPQAFLDAVESDLRATSPALVAMLRPTTAVMFDSPDRTGLLWALETLAWNPVHLPRVLRILARLSETPIEDNWINKPENSLASILRSWMPQTAADLPARLDALDLVCKTAPDVGWRPCLASVSTSHRIGNYNVRPRWRHDAAGAGEVVTRGDDFAMRRRALDLLEAWSQSDVGKLGDLVEQAGDLPPGDQNKILARAESWLASGPSDTDRASLKERVRTVFLGRHRRSQELTEEGKRFVDFSNRLTPADAVS